MRGVPHLKELDKKYRDRGFVLLAVSAEDEGPIAGFVSDQSPGYRVIRNSQIAKLYELKGWPSAWVLDAEGKCLWAGHLISEVKDEQWEAWLSELAPPKVGRAVSKELSGAVKAFDKGEIGKAMTDARKIAEGLPADETASTLKADCDYVLELCNKHVAVVQNKLKGAADAVAKVKMLEEAAGRFKGSEFGDKWGTEAKELKKSKDYEAAEALAKLKPLLRDLTPRTAKRRLESLAKKYPETAAGKEADEMARAIVD